VPVTGARCQPTDLGRYLISLSSSRATIRNTPLGNGRSSALASSHGAQPDVAFFWRRQDHRHAFGRIGSTIAFGAVVAAIDG
jgi:hypothetical protein